MSLYITQHSKKHNNLHNTKNIKHTKNTKHTKKLLVGGKYIDKGGFGCVISPALSCNNNDKPIKHKHTMKKKLNNYVSKIIRKTDITAMDELKISTILKKIDPMQKYFLTYHKYCYISNIQKNRDDIINVHYTNDLLTEFDISDDDKTKHKNACHIDLKLKPLNIIMEHGGYSLYNIIKYTNIHKEIHTQKEKQTKIGIKMIMHTLFLDNLKSNIKHLLLGMVKMHNTRIANRDIKHKNIMMKLVKNDDNTNTIFLRYIDFGLSVLLTTKHCNDINNISLSGTKHYISPELYISYIYHKYNTDYSEKDIIKKIKHEIHNNVKRAFKIINELDLLNDLDTHIITLYERIKFLYKTKKLLPHYFGTIKHKSKGYLQKNDVYALGLTIFEVLYLFSDYNVRENEPLYDLLKNMLVFDPVKRYNVVQCINHRYFKT